MTTGKKPNNNKPLHKLKKFFFEAFPLLAFAYEQQLGCVNCVQQLELAKIMFAFFVSGTRNRNRNIYRRSRNNEKFQ
jgi:hypothetical protein